MTLYYFEKNLQCNLDPHPLEDCKYSGFVINEQIKQNLGLVADRDRVEFHVSVHHSRNGLHRIWIFIYDNDNIHESEVNGRIVRQNNPLVRKPTRIPPKNEIETEVERPLTQSRLDRLLRRPPSP